MCAINVNNYVRKMINVNDQYSVQVFSALENDLISLSPSDGLGNVMNGGGGVMGGPCTHAMQIPRPSENCL